MSYVYYIECHGFSDRPENENRNCKKFWNLHVRKEKENNGVTGERTKHPTTRAHTHIKKIYLTVFPPEKVLMHLVQSRVN